MGIPDWNTFNIKKITKKIIWISVLRKILEILNCFAKIMILKFIVSPHLHDEIS